MSESKTRDMLIDMKRQLTPADLREAELKLNFTKKKADVKKFKGRMARLKGMLTQWGPYKTQIENYIARKEKESKNLPEKIARLKKIVKNECAHPVESLEVTEQYFNGSHEEKASTEYYVQCKLCGKKDCVKTETHNYYG